MGKTGLTSVTFRKLTPDEIIKLCVRARVDGIEWGGDVHVPAGNIALAKEIGKKTRDAGLETFSYGSYYNLGDGTQSFSDVSKTALGLGACVICIWTGFGEFDAERYKKAIKETREIADIAADNNQTICFEFHAGTINDSGASGLKLINDIGKDNVFTYWQPIYGLESDINSLSAIKGKVKNVHVFHWKSYEERYALSEGVDKWRKYVDILGKEHNYLLEFVKNDSPEQFLLDAAVLKKLIGAK